MIFFLNKEPVFANEDSCSHIDLSGRIPTLNVFRPTTRPNSRSQGEFGICYAAALSDLLSAELGVAVSQIDAALQHDHHSLLKNTDFFLGASESDLDGGWIGSALTALQSAGGACPNALVPSHNERLNFYPIIEKHWRQYRRDWLKDRYSKTRLPEHLKQDPLIQNYVRTDLLRFLFPETAPDLLHDALRKSTFSTPLLDLVNTACNGHRISLQGIRHKRNRSRWQVQTFFDGTFDFSHAHRAWPLIQDIHRALEHGKMAGISIDSKILQEPALESPSQNHAMLVVGRTRDEYGTCRLLVRNSWGIGCKHYHPSYLCSRGYAWIPENNLVRGLFETYTVTRD